jgi:HEAT repeat protein
MNVRFGAGAVFEHFAGRPALQDLVARLGDLAGHADARVRADACHYLGLSGSALARPYLEPRLTDSSAEVREIAADSLAEVDDSIV